MRNQKSHSAVLCDIDKKLEKVILKHFAALTKKRNLQHLAALIRKKSKSEALCGFDKKPKKVKQFSALIRNQK